MSPLPEGSARSQTVQELGAPFLEAWEGRLDEALEAFASDPGYLLKIATNYGHMRRRASARLSATSRAR